MILFEWSRRGGEDIPANMINPGSDKPVANVLVLVNTAKGIIRFVPASREEGKRGYMLEL